MFLFDSTWPFQFFSFVPAMGKKRGNESRPRSRLTLLFLCSVTIDLSCFVLSTYVRVPFRLDSTVSTFFVLCYVVSKRSCSTRLGRFSFVPAMKKKKGVLQYVHVLFRLGYENVSFFCVLCCMCCLETCVVSTCSCSNRPDRFNMFLFESTRPLQFRPGDGEEEQGRTKAVRDHDRAH